MGERIAKAVREDIGKYRDWDSNMRDVVRVKEAIDKRKRLVSDASSEGGSGEESYSAGVFVGSLAES